MSGSMLQAVEIS